MLSCRGLPYGIKIIYDFLTLGVIFIYDRILNFLGPYRLTVRTAPFHGVNPGSIPGKVTN